MPRRRRLLTEAQWEKIRPLLPKPKKRKRGGRPRVNDRSVLEGILWILRNGTRWSELPEQYPSPSTCWRRLRDWQEAGNWQLIHFVFLNWLARYDQIAWSRAVVDGSSVRAVFGGCRRGRTPPIEPNRAASAI